MPLGGRDCRFSMLCISAFRTSAFILQTYPVSHSFILQTYPVSHSFILQTYPVSHKEVLLINYSDSFRKKAAAQRSKVTDPNFLHMYPNWGIYLHRMTDWVLLVTDY